MAKFQQITKEEFLSLFIGRHPSPMAAETMAAKKLRPNEGFKIPCHWVHNSFSNKIGCGGTNLIKRAAKTEGFELQTFCNATTLYAFRFEKAA